jgi:hypothetical protein
MRRLGEPHRAIERSDQERPAPGLRHPILLRAEHPDRSLITVDGEQAGEQGPQLEDGRDLLHRHPARPQRERPPQRLDRQQRTLIQTGRAVLGAGVVASGELVCASDHPRLVDPPEALAGRGVSLAWRRGDQPPHRTKRSRVEVGDVALDPLVPRRPRGLAGELVVVDPDCSVAELPQALIQAASPGEQVHNQAVRDRAISHDESPSCLRRNAVGRRGRCRGSARGTVDSPPWRRRVSGR